MRPALRAIRAASASSSVSLPSSEGWNWKNGSWIQRREPRVEKPSSEDGRDEPDRADVERPLEAPEALDVDERQHAQRDRAEREVDLLADDELVAAGARADHVEPERGDAREREQHAASRAAARGRTRSTRRVRRSSRARTRSPGIRTLDMATSTRPRSVPRFGFGVLKTLE